MRKMRCPYFELNDLERAYHGGALAVYFASPDEINIDPYIEYMLQAGVEVVAPRWSGETYELAKLKGQDEKSL